MSYVKFKKQWHIGHPPKGGVPRLPSQPTMSRLWSIYRRNNKLKNIKGKKLIDWMVSQFKNRILDPENAPNDLKKNAISAMVQQQIVMPSAYRFRRAFGAAKRIFRQDEGEARITRLENTLGVTIDKLPIIKRWTAAHDLLKYPSASVGRANLPKMAEEHRIFCELSKILIKNNLNPAILLSDPNAQDLYHFVERHPPSILDRWEKRKMLQALPFYLAVRLQESLDAILLCFIRKARLLNSRIREEVEENRREESLALLEKSGRHIRALQNAIGEALALGTPTPLLPHQKTLSRLSRDRETTLDRNRLYHLIGSRGAYTRKIARRLVGIHFHGHNQHANEIVQALQEVLGFSPFDKKVPKALVEKVSFLQVPSGLLVKRQVFEPVVIITLADFLWSGRVTVSLSRRFSNVWTDVPEISNTIDPMAFVAHRRRQLNKAWTAFEKIAKDQGLVKDGRLNIRKLARRLSDMAEDRHRRRHQELVSNFRLITILEVVLKVHKSTNYLDEFKLSRKSPHQLSNEERLKLASGILIAEGMNVGIREMSTVLGHGYLVGRVQNFMNGYMTKENLESALRRLLSVWDEKKMGKPWGPGELVSVDGRVIGAFQNNLLSRYHYRKGRSGMTVYWFRRDDGIATRVRSLGNQEWEAWHVLDELLHPLTRKELRSSCGDTQGQFLPLWGLAELVDKNIMARFRRPSRVQLFKPSGKNRADIKNLRTVRWDIIEQGFPSMCRLAEGIRTGKIRAVDILRRWHLFDDSGFNVMMALRELGKVSRTEFLLRYAGDKDIQRVIRDACNDAEMWNSFHEAIFWGNGGKLRSNDPSRHDEALLALTLLMNSIVFYNVETYGEKLKKAKAPTPIIWDHIQVLGRYQFRRSWISRDSPSVN